MNHPDDTPPTQTVRWRGGGFAIVPNALIETLPDCIQVFAALAKYADREGRCFPGLDTLADDLGVSRATVKRRIKALREAGWLTIIKRSQKTNVYYLHEYASEGSDLSPHDSEGSPVSRHEGSPMTPEQEPEAITKPSPNGRPSTKSVTPLPKSDQLVGASPQVTRRLQRGQRKARASGQAGTVIPSGSAKPKRENPGDIARRLIKEGKIRDK